MRRASSCEAHLLERADADSDAAQGLETKRPFKLGGLGDEMGPRENGQR